MAATALPSARPMNDGLGQVSFTEFVAAHQRRLLRFAYLVTGNQADAEDAVQDALIKTAQRWHTLRPEGALAYLRRVVINQALENKRRIKDTPVQLAGDAGGAGADYELLRYEEDQAFFGRLQLLPPKQRAAVILRYYLDLPDREVASYLECSPQTVRSQIHRALESLRHSMTSSTTEPDDEA